MHRHAEVMLYLSAFAALESFAVVYTTGEPHDLIVQGLQAF
jgi:hypothetical protein